MYLGDHKSDPEKTFHLLNEPGLRFESLLAPANDEFLQRVKISKPDVIIFEDCFPQFSATRALKIVRDLFINVPFIVLTDLDSKVNVADINQIVADDYILKEDIASLREVIEKLLLKKDAEAHVHRYQEEIKFQKGLLAAAGQAIIATDLTGKIVYWNNAAERMYGWTDMEVLGRNIIEVTPSAEMKEASLTIMEELTTGKPWSGEFLVQRKDGAVFPVFVTDTPIRDQDGSITGIIGVSHDISGQKKAEAAVKEMEAEISNQRIQEQKKISRAILQAEEEERNHIGKELHDNINQLLAGTRLYLTLAAKSNEKAKELIKYSLELLDNSIDEIRQLSSKYVISLKNIDLPVLISKLVDNLNAATSIKAGFSYNIAAPLMDDELKLNIFRITQELVSNVIKHANANEVSITINETGDEIAIEVTDNGKGFDFNEKRNGIGISNIMDRTESFNGVIDIQTSYGNGCKVGISLPAKYKAEAHRKIHEPY